MYGTEYLFFQVEEKTEIKNHKPQVVIHVIFFLYYI